MDTYFLAIDIGASNGRHLLACNKDGRMRLEEVYRFANGMTKKDGELCWDLDLLFTEIKTGMKRCKEIGKAPVSVGIDAWGVDFVLLDRNDDVIGNAVGYRDSRTLGMDQKVYEVIPEEELYARTGIQKMILNTIYQLMSVKQKRPEHLAKAECMLMIPDYFNFLLCGVKKTEYTNATTTQLVNPQNRDWDEWLIGSLGYPRRIFSEIAKPGTVLGNLRHEICEEIGYDCSVVLPATHDTASAVLAVPFTRSTPSLYISSGTWSLIGIERREADCSAKSRVHNFTNEGGYGDSYCYLKNIMGLWMIQSVRKEMNDAFSYPEICKMASTETIGSLVDCNDSRFLAPDSMTRAVQDFCRESGQQVPVTIGEIAAVIYNSLARCYRDTIEDIEQITGHAFESIHIVGGGANNDYLNRLTTGCTGKRVYAGPTEAAAIGNIIAQMMCRGELTDIIQARKCVYESFEIVGY